MELSNLVELIELFELLGYQDERSVLKWCARNKIPVIKLGIKKYVSSHLLTQSIDNQLLIFVKRNDASKIKPEDEVGNSPQKTKKSEEGIYQPNNELISKYLAKYESASKVNPSKKTAP